MAMVIDASVAEKSHVYFRHGITEDWKRDAERPLVQDLVQRVVK